MPLTQWTRSTPKLLGLFLCTLGGLCGLDFDLPSKQVFPPEMPRYPNLWFYVDASLAQSQAEAVQLVANGLRKAMRLRQYPGPFTNPEGSDSDFRLEHLQPWEDRDHRHLQHSHALHLRYYHSALAKRGLDMVTWNGRRHYRLAASVHYEVEHTNPNHPDVEICPVCGRTGEYANLKGNLVEMAHDPLGLELVLTGKIRGQVVRFEDWKEAEVGGIQALEKQFRVEKHVLDGLSGDRNTLRIGVVVLSPKP